MKSKVRYFIIALIWLGAGYLCSLIEVYLFSFGTWKLVSPVSKFMHEAFNSYLVSELTNFLLFYITRFLLVLLFAFALSRVCGKKILWFVSFIAGVTGYSIYLAINSFIFYSNKYEMLPSWAISTLSQELIAYIVLIPVLGGIGTALGERTRQKTFELANQ